MMGLEPTTSDSQTDILPIKLHSMTHIFLNNYLIFDRPITKYSYVHLLLIGFEPILLTIMSGMFCQLNYRSLDLN